MKKKLLIIIPIVIIIIILLILFFFRFESYTLKVVKITDAKVYAEQLNENDWYYFLYKNNIISLGTDISNIKEGDTIRVWKINFYQATSNGLATFYEDKPSIEIDGLKIIRVL